MPKKYPPLTYSEVIAILKANDFELKATKGSHEQWEGSIKGATKKVTVDKAYPEYDSFLMSSMIRQSALSRDDFYCSLKNTAKKINKKCRKDLK